MSETIHFSMIITLLKNKLTIILSFTLIGLLAGLFFSFLLLTPNYKSTVQVIVAQDTESQIVQNTEVQANIQLVNTYNEIIKSPFIIEKVVADLDGHYTVSGISKMIKVGNETNSQVINISVESEIKKESIHIANVVAQTFKRNAAEVMKIGSIHILSNSKYSTASTRKSPIIYVGIGVIVGIVSGILFSFLLIALDTTLKTEEDILDQLSIPVLGSVGKIK
ncbi:Wzz/FepE/Etk N-terminal domain-containing protein [Carnobacterium maltaromaticum]|uniref:Capsular polysaccharide biosynthesis protein CpsC n=1 Tax=Carnobacterium maltaromaticum TaxID=2751 RepID=A0AAW9K4A4_CARML|nr:Wzz/FepE/Etk N-terminal domain-containing protein [Carnobacterium maltaromaticum]MDZ5759571.1 Wzz/FepE/Etk N-terminal domain-containing protein [Carnobacterium maltaromaticum]